MQKNQTRTDRPLDIQEDRTPEQLAADGDYYDAKGKPISLDQLTRTEPAWAANVIRKLKSKTAWILCSKRMPTEEDGGRLGLVIWAGTYEAIPGDWDDPRCCVEWMPLPSIPIPPEVDR